jgi:uncharacterized protein (TIGR03000 family)
MYSLVLMAAMSTSPESMEFNDFFVNRRIYATWGQYGCGVVPSGYVGTCYGCGVVRYGCGVGSNCTGCSGFRMGFLGLGGRWHGRMVSCYGSSCCGGYGYSAPLPSFGCGASCYSSCSGCCGGISYYSSCTGCTGYSIYGGTSYSVVPSMGCTGCYGTSSYSSPVPTGVVPGSVIEIKEVAPAPAPIIEMKKVSQSDSRAAVLVKLPADAKLYANNQLTALSSDERFFYTPALPDQAAYTYQLRVEYMRDGELVRDQQKIMVRAGEQTEVRFEEKVTKLTTSKAIVKLPADAKLFIDEHESGMQGPVREYNTPKLQSGETYVYRFRAEVTRNGKKEVQSQLVNFKGGQPFEVDFRDLDTKDGTFASR